MLGVVGSNMTSFKLEPTTRNMSQQGAKRTQHVAPNNVAICCAECCYRLAGALGRSVMASQKPLMLLGLLMLF